MGSQKNTMSDGIKKKIALITGGGSGLGLAIATLFAKKNIIPVLVGRREDVLKEANQKIGADSKYFAHDVTQLETLPQLVEKVESEIGPIDILVNNAGIHLKKDVLDVTDEEYEKVITTNQRSVFALSRECAKKFAGREQGNILMISSMAALYGIPKVIAYTAAKTAIEGMTKALAVELSPMGIRVNSLAPGFIKTAMSSKAFEADPGRLQRVLDRTPMKRLGLPEDVAEAAYFLVSDASSFITGVCLPVDGGNSIGF